MATPDKIAEMQKLFQNSSAYTHLQGKNQAVNRFASVIVPGVLFSAAAVMLVNGCHKLYTGQGKLE